MWWAPRRRLEPRGPLLRDGLLRFRLPTPSSLLRPRRRLCPNEWGGLEDGLGRAADNNPRPGFQASSENCDSRSFRRSDIRLLLGVIGAPLAPPFSPRRRSTSCSSSCCRRAELWRARGFRGELRCGAGAWRWAGGAATTSSGAVPRFEEHGVDGRHDERPRSCSVACSELSAWSHRSRQWASREGYAAVARRGGAGRAGTCPRYLRLIFLLDHGETRRGWPREWLSDMYRFAYLIMIRFFYILFPPDERSEC